MFIVYNIKQKLKIDATMGPQTCPNCGHQAVLSLARERNTVCLFFILPIFAWTAKRSYCCPYCGCPARYTKAEYEQLKLQFPTK